MALYSSLLTVLLLSFQLEYISASTTNLTYSLPSNYSFIELTAKMTGSDPRANGTLNASLRSADNTSGIHNIALYNGTPGHARAMIGCQNERSGGKEFWVASIPIKSDPVLLEDTRKDDSGDWWCNDTAIEKRTGSGLIVEMTIGVGA